MGIHRVLHPLLASAVVGVLETGARADEGLRLDWNKPIRCMPRPDGTTVRVQCDETGGRCLVASDQNVFGDPLDRTKPCDTNEDASAFPKLLASKTLVAATAEAPPGYERSANGRAYQVKFDLLNRFYLGTGWLPGFDTVRAGGPLGRGYTEMGIHLSFLLPSSRSRHDLRILEGAASFAELEFRGTLFAYDYQHTRRRPAYWITSFIGEPSVYPVRSRLAFGFRLVSFSDRPRSSRDTSAMASTRTRVER